MTRRLVIYSSLLVVAAACHDSRALDVMSKLSEAMETDTEDESARAVAELKQLSDSEWSGVQSSIASMARELTEERKVRFASILVAGLSTERAARILSENVFDLSDVYQRWLFVLVFLGAEFQNDGDLNFVLQIFDTIFLQVVEERKATANHELATETLHDLTRIFGKCGQEGFDRLVAIDGYEFWTLEALGEMGTPESLQFVLDQYRSHPRESVRIDALTSMARRFGMYNESVREEMLAGIIALGASEKSTDRTKAARIAGFTRDPSLIPFLRSLIDSDDTIVERGPAEATEQYYPVREEAKTAIDSIKQATDPNARRIQLLRMMERDALDTIPRIEQDIANGIKVEMNQRYLQSEKDKLEEVQQELEVLEAAAETP